MRLDLVGFAWLWKPLTLDQRKMAKGTDKTSVIRGSMQQGRASRTENQRLAGQFKPSDQMQITGVNFQLHLHMQTCGAVSSWAHQNSFSLARLTASWTWRGYKRHRRTPQWADAEEKCAFASDDYCPHGNVTGKRNECWATPNPPRCSHHVWIRPPPLCISDKPVRSG